MSSQTIVTIVLGVVEMVAFSIMSRVLTQEDFGYFAALTAITTVFSSLTHTGIGAAIIQTKNLTKTYANSAFTINLIVGLFVSLLLFALSGPLANALLDSSMVRPVQLMSITLLCSCLTSPAGALMSRRLQFLQKGVISLISLVVSTTVAVILAIKGFSYYAIVSKHVLGSVLTLVLTQLYVHAGFRLHLNREDFRSIFKFSGWLMASTIVSELAHQVDSLLIPRLISVNALGAYSRPKSFINQTSAKFNGIFDTAMFPVLSSIQDDKKKIVAAFNRSFYYMNIISMILSLTYLFNSELLIRIFFGEKWDNIIIIMNIVSFNVFASAVGRLSDIFLRSLAMTKQQFVFRVIELFVSLSSLIIGYKWGVMGVAIAATTTNMILKFTKVMYVSHKIGIPIKDSFKNLFSSWKFTLFLVPPMIIALLLTGNNWVGDIIVAVSFVVVCILVFLVFPQCVGKRYKEDAYCQILSFIKNKIRRK